ncbi:unnamed protein product [Clonostachys chloroleuca]|uniref:Uncharacterized protein n=1 Tax=Clonostachys chloroleuca TaxID=1926264 RepID=A0AA35MF36_9HYPO|nr:unnamed protein product [Clonostachys chloroleuca]
MTLDTIALRSMGFRVRQFLFVRDESVYQSHVTEGRSLPGMFYRSEAQRSDKDNGKSVLLLKRN